MRKRILLVISLTLIGMLAIIMVTTRLIILDSFSDLQESYMEKDVARFLSAIDDDLEGMNGAAGDWAEWDETYAYVRNPDPGYIERNLEGFGAFENLRVNIVLLADTAGKIVFKKAVDLQREREIPFPAGLESFLKDHHPDLASEKKGIVLIPAGPLLLCSRPILDNRGNGPVHGTLIMCRFMDSAYIAKLAQRTRFAVSLEPLSSPEMPKDYRDAESRISSFSPVLMRPLTVNTVAGYTLLRDITGAPVLMARIVVPRDIDREGFKTLVYFMISISVIGVVFGAVVLLFLEKALISRVHALSAGVLTVGTGNNLSLRVSMNGTDELAYLGAAINGMLTALEQSSADLKRSEARNEAFLAATPDMIFRLAGDGTLIDFRWPAGAPLKPFPRDLIGTDIGGLPFIFPFITADLVDRITKAIAESSATGAPQTFEFPLTIDDAESHFEARIVAGTENETVIFIHDITAEKKVKDAQKNEILLKEIHHRVKNNLQVISSLLDLQARSSHDERTTSLLRESQDRLRSMSLIHEKLYRAGNATGVSIVEYVHDLAAHLRNSFSGSSEAIEMETDVEGISLDMDIAVPCGLIITELVSNALKYAFPDGRKGRIRIGLKQDEKHTIELSVSDDGIGLPADLDHREASSLGLRIVNILVNQLKGTLEHYGEGGTRFVISFPVIPSQ
jgi:two-component sensor histidine kinase/sensor domain CHASE-containing protein